VDVVVAVEVVKLLTNVQLTNLKNITIVLDRVTVESSHFFYYRINVKNYLEKIFRNVIIIF
jgi:hypothetical protein